MDMFGQTFKPLWKSWKEFKIQDVENHVVLFVFQTDTDVERVLMNEPWSFDKHLFYSNVWKIILLHRILISLTHCPGFNYMACQWINWMLNCRGSRKDCRHSSLRIIWWGVTLCVLEFELIFQNHSVGVTKLFLKMVRKVLDVCGTF